MNEFERPIESGSGSPELALLLTEIWVDGVPVDVSGDMGIEFMPTTIGIRGGSGAGKRRRKKLRFPSRLTF